MNDVWGWGPLPGYPKRWANNQVKINGITSVGDEAFRSAVQRPIRRPPNGRPVSRSYRYGGDTAMPEAEVRSRVLEARRRARDRIAGDIEAGAWWVPQGFTVADLDALIAETYR